MFTFEDLTRSGPSDQDFTDIAFSIDSELMPMSRMIGGEIIPINTTSLLLAGIQTNLAWIIPVLVAAGIGAVLIRKKF